VPFAASAVGAGAAPASFSSPVGVGWRTAPVETPAVDPLNETGELAELPVPQQQAPLMAHSRLVGRRALVTLAELPRAGRAILHDAAFPPLVPLPPGDEEVQIPTGPARLQPSLESRDVCQANQICFQFMAFAPVAGTGASVGIGGMPAPWIPQHIVVGFRFYKFAPYTSPRLQLAPGSTVGDAASLPRVLTSSVSPVDARPLPGLDVRYMVDPTVLGHDERARFTAFLDEKTLLVDVWDGDSMLFIGTAELELCHLLRGGHRLIANTVELPVVRGEMAASGGGDRTQGGGCIPTQQGSLYLGISNVGHVVSVPERGRVGHSSCVVLVTSHHDAVRQKQRNKAARLAECDPELAMALNRAHPDPRDDEAARKARRLAAIRKRGGGLETLAAIPHQVTGKHEPFTTTVKPGSASAAVLVHTAGDLKTIEAYRARRKRDTIRQLLSEAITSTHVIYPSFGEAVYLEVGPEIGVSMVCCRCLVLPGPLCRADGPNGADK